MSSIARCSVRNSQNTSLASARPVSNLLRLQACLYGMMAALCVRMIATADRTTQYAVRVTLANGGNYLEWILARTVGQALACAHTMYALDNEVASIRYAGVNLHVERR